MTEFYPYGNDSDGNVKNILKILDSRYGEIIWIDTTIDKAGGENLSQDINNNHKKQNKTLEQKGREFCKM